MNEVQVVTNLVLHSRSGHNGIENHSEKLFLVSLGGSQHHEAVLDGGAVQVVQRHVLRSGQRLWVNRRRWLVQDNMPQMRRQSGWPV